ncbi:carbohydrate kinase [Microbacterium oryzae]|uniref:carbohydrate kinase family protein n=1 Tax=Microbacterium oryzae TaxID=743009 RepID=UPI0025B1A9C5|nr:carbohydrate kinase [Microbacterium oryzae]MDN3312008.1 carbohydrate kinase [Microbacterium oryzae]
MALRSQTDVLVIGEALIDIVAAADGATEHVGGSPANVALGLGRLGVDVALLTRIGADERGARIAARLGDSGVHILPEAVVPAATSTATARIGTDGSATYAFDIDWSLPEAVAPTAKVVHTGSIAAFLEPGAASVLAILRTCDAAEITFDPNIRPALVGDRATAFARFQEIAAASTVVKMSDEDAGWLFPDVPVDEVAKRVLALGPRMVAVTLGADGALLATAEHVVRIPPVRVDVVDTLGAGDTFMASLIRSLVNAGSRDLDEGAMESIGRAAAAAAAVTVSRAGADLPWARELAARD